MQVVNLRSRPDEFFRGAMALQAPLHVERLGAPGERHLVELAVAGRTADAVPDMDAVVEVDEIGQVVDPIPSQRLVRRQALADRPEQGCFGPDLRVTGHANLRAGDAGKGGFLDRAVAVTAIDPIVADVMFVAERHRLLERDLYVGRIGRPENRRGRPARAAKENHEADDQDFGMNVGAAGKNLGHCLTSRVTRPAPSVPLPPGLPS